jgi:hypothetical protein
MPFEPCRYLRFKELFEPEFVAACQREPGIPAVAHAWCNRTLKETGADGGPVSMVTCSRPGRACYRLYVDKEPLG